MSLKVGMPAPDFELPDHLGNRVKLSTLRGRNVVLAFFPRAWTPVCTSQIPAYEAEKDTFTSLNAQVLAISIDHVPCLQAWAESLGGISYPLLSDFWPHGAVSQRYGVLRSEGYSERAVFVIDRHGILRYIDIHDINTQPSNEDIRRVLRQIDPQAAAGEPKTDQPVDARLPHGGIVMYCTSWCPDCRRARAWFKEHNLEYTEVDITKTPGAAEQVMKWANGSKTTPTFDIDGVIVVDWNEARLREVLKDRLK